MVPGSCSESVAVLAVEQVPSRRNVVEPGSDIAGMDDLQPSRGPIPRPPKPPEAPVIPRTNHILHLILTIITVGLWAFIWVMVALNNYVSARDRTREYKKALAAYEEADWQWQQQYGFYRR